MLNLKEFDSNTTTSFTTDALGYFVQCFQSNNYTFSLCKL